MITLTPKATAKIREIIAAEQATGKGLRVYVEGGGCSGFMYGFELDEPREGDNIIPLDGFDVYVDPFSAGHLKDSTVDYDGGLNGTGFRVHNPNAKGSCGCGQSFS
jgi:iron-sulfur cluster assembly accessory protein